MASKIQISLDELERIVAAAKEAKKYDSSLSNTIEIEQVEACPFHTGSDRLIFWQKSGYAECNSKYLDTI
jgi:hypothetical protein